VVHHCNGVANLSVIFAGNPDPRASELMASPRMAEVLAQLHRSYRNLFVVIDCSPVISPEAAALAGHVHHTIMVVAAEQASRAEVHDAIGHVSACRDVSLVFNKSPRWRKRDDYYQYRYRYAGPGQGVNPDFGAG
jgi:Mrp family chromosome partitioning ATPase